MDDDYTIFHVGISGGKDSTALLLWAVYESGYPRERIRASFCDTDNEVEETYAYIRMLSERVHPIEWLTPPLGFYDLARRKNRFPSPKARFCTQQLKMLPTQLYLLELMRSGERVLLHSGVRAQESAARARLQEREWDEYYACDVYRPLLNWSLDQVWAMLAKYDIPRNPLYDLGARRVGCFPCIMSSKAEIKLIADKFPERIDMIRRAEAAPWAKGVYHTFFARDKVPEPQRSVLITTAKGESMFVASIDDVVRWSRTAQGGLQLPLDLFEDEQLVCNSTLGHCE